MNILKSKVNILFDQKEKHNYLLWPLIFLVISSLFLSIFLVRDLEWEEHISIEKGSLLFIYGLIFFTALYNTLNYLCLNTSYGKLLAKNYKLTKEVILDINNKQVSAVQALFCCITGLIVYCYSCTRNMLKTSHYISEAYAWFGAAYFLYDIWSMYHVHSATTLPNVHLNSHVKFNENVLNKFFNYIVDNAIIVGHHIFIGAFGFLVITYLRGGLGDCFFGFVYLMEASTPFVSLRGILSKLNLKESKLYVVNGLVMLGTFFICRVAMFPYVIYLYAQSMSLDYISAVHTLPRGCKISILILLLPQVYWFMLMLRGATRVLKPKMEANVTKHKKHNVTNSHS